MIKLIIRKILWSDNRDSQLAYDRGRHDQAEEDAIALMEWLVDTGQIRKWLAPKIEVVEEEEA